MRYCVFYIGSGHANPLRSLDSFSSCFTSFFLSEARHAPGGKMITGQGQSWQLEKDFNRSAEPPRESASCSSSMVLKQGWRKLGLCPLGDKTRAVAVPSSSPTSMGSHHHKEARNRPTDTQTSQVWVRTASWLPGCFSMQSGTHGACSGGR